MRSKKLSKFTAVSVLFTAILFVDTRAAAQTEKVLHDFTSTVAGTVFEITP